MPSEPIADKLATIFREAFEDDSIEFTLALTADDLEAWNSLGHIRLITALEEAFQVRFDLDEIESLNSVARILDSLKSKAAGDAAP
jgi:acyl carrier protein